MSWEEPAAREYPAAGQPAYDGVPPSLGTVEGTAAPVLSWSVPWCRRAWLARLRAPGQGLDPVAVAAASQPETVWGVPQLQPREQPFDQVLPPCPGAAQEQHRSHGVAKDTSSGVGSTASCSHWRALTVATTGGTTVRRGS